MSKFNWHVEYFDGADEISAVRKTIIQADSAGEAETIAKSQIGLHKRADLKRADNAAPIRVCFPEESDAASLA